MSYPSASTIAQGALHRLPSPCSAAFPSPTQGLGMLPAVPPPDCAPTPSGLCSWDPPGLSLVETPSFHLPVPGQLPCSPVDIPSQGRMPCPDQTPHAPHGITCHCDSHICPCRVTTVSPAPRAGPGTYDSVNIRQLVRGQKEVTLKCQLNCHLALPQA